MEARPEPDERSASPRVVIDAVDGEDHLTDQDARESVPVLEAVRDPISGAFASVEAGVRLTDDFARSAEEKGAAREFRLGSEGEPAVALPQPAPLLGTGESVDSRCGSRCPRSAAVGTPALVSVRATSFTTCRIPCSADRTGSRSTTRPASAVASASACFPSTEDRRDDCDADRGRDPRRGLLLGGASPFAAVDYTDPAGVTRFVPVGPAGVFLDTFKAASPGAWTVKAVVMGAWCTRRQPAAQPRWHADPRIDAERKGPGSTAGPFLAHRLGKIDRDQEAARGFQPRFRQPPPSWGR
jgi:hypothetical protein